MIGAVWKLIIFTSMVNRIINNSSNERIILLVYDTCLHMFDVCTLGYTAHIEAILQFLPHWDQHVRCDGPALFPLQRHPVIWKCWYQHLMLLRDGGITVELSPECQPNWNNWFMLHKLQHTIRSLLRSRHYRCVTSQTEREKRGVGLRMSRKLEQLLFRSRSGKLTSACVFKAVMADWNRSNHFDTPCVVLPENLVVSECGIYCSVCVVSITYAQSCGTR